MSNRDGKLALGLWGVVIFILALVLGIGLIGGPMVQGIGKELSADHLIWEKTFDETDIKKLALDIQSLEVEVKPVDGEAIKLSYYSSNEAAKDTLKAEKNKETLQIKEESSLNFFSQINISKKLVIEIPEYLVAEYELALASGSVKIGSVKMASFKGTVASGSVKMEPYYEQTLENLDLQIASGSVKIYGAVRNLNTEVTSGSFKYDGYYEAGQFKASSGDIKVQTQVQPKVVDVQVTSGSVKLGMPQPDDVQVNSNVSSGSIKNLYTNGSYGEGSFKQGTGSTIINVKVSSGSVKIDQELELELENMVQF